MDDALSGAFEIPGPIVGQNELTASAPPSEEGPYVISPSSSAPAMPDSSVIASSSSSDTSVAAPPTESAAPDEEQPADHTHSPDVSVPNAPEGSTTSSTSAIEYSPSLNTTAVIHVAQVPMIFKMSQQPNPKLNSLALRARTRARSSRRRLPLYMMRRIAHRSAKAESQSSNRTHTLCQPSLHRLLCRWH